MTLGESTSRRGILDPEAARRHFRLERIAPAPDLAHLIERHWTVEWDLREPFTQEIVTHPSVNMVFEPGAGRALVHGVVRTTSRHELTGRGKVLGTKFRPGGFHPFVPVSAHTLTDRAISLADAFGPTDLAERVFASGLDIAVVEGFLRWRDPEPDPNVRLIAELHAAILADPNVTRVDQVTALAGCSARTLQRLFREYVGVSPKWVLQRIRLHEAAERMAGGEGDWAGLAIDLGYFDQAHFIKAFKAVVGRSPAEYAAAAA